MFFHNFKYTIKTLFRDKVLIFWTFAFPLLMATFFNLAFGDIIAEDQLKIIEIAIVNNDEYENNMLYKETFEYLSDDQNEDKLFNITYTNKEDASNLLNDDKIDGYLELNDNTPKLTFKSNGINQTIFKYVVDKIHDTESIIKTKIEEMMMDQTLDVTSNVQDITSDISSYLETNNITLENKANSNLDYMMIEYYTLIAMTCLYAGTLGMVAINKSLPYLKGNGRRICVSPANKFNIVISSLLSSYVVQLMTIGLLFIYTTQVLHINYGDRYEYIALLSVVGSIAGVALGLFIGTHIKASDNSKTGILIAFTMAGSFLAGMMGVGMKYVIDKNLPLLNKINPANMITDGFYSLYYYSDLNRFWFDVISIVIFSLVLILLSARKVGKTRYDSI